MNPKTIIGDETLMGEYKGKEFSAGYRVDSDPVPDDWKCPVHPGGEKLDFAVMNNIVVDDEIDYDDVIVTAADPIYAELVAYVQSQLEHGKLECALCISDECDESEAAHKERKIISGEE